VAFGKYPRRAVPGKAEIVFAKKVLNTNTKLLSLMSVPE
jgi:hypothetical protein